MPGVQLYSVINFLLFFSVMTQRLNASLAFAFPGQGSQFLGMLNELAAVYPVVGQTFGTASSVLGYDVWELVSTGPEDRLNDTRFTQPAMLTAGVAAWRVWTSATEVCPAWMAGHSLGEFTALVCADALNFEDGLLLVSERGKLMQEAVPTGKGAMAAILGLADDQVVELCSEFSKSHELVSAANFNSPGQVVVAGDKAAVELTIAAAKAAGAKRAVVLPVSVPSHCPLMEAAAEQFDILLKDIPIRSPRIPVIHNVDAVAHHEPDAIRAALRKQLFSPVQWTNTIRVLADQGADSFVECGPGKVLAGLIKRIAAGARIGMIHDSDSLTKALELA